MINLLIGVIDKLVELNAYILYIAAAVNNVADVFFREWNYSFGFHELIFAF